MDEKNVGKNGRRKVISKVLYTQKDGISIWTPTLGD